MKEKQSSSPGTLRLVVILPEEDSDAQLQPIFNDMEKPKADVGSLESSLLQIVEEHNQSYIRIRDQSGWFYSLFLSSKLPPPHKITKRHIRIPFSNFNVQILHLVHLLFVWVFLVPCFFQSHISICCIS